MASPSFDEANSVPVARKNDQTDELPETSLRRLPTQLAPRRNFAAVIRTDKEIVIAAQTVASRSPKTGRICKVR
jgi:hypothetical protein